MGADDQSRWDRQHGASHGEQAPSRFLREIIEGEHWRVPPGKALDLACGKGRNALFLASRGFQVTAIDISPVALEQGRKRADRESLSISWRQADLEQVQLPWAEYDLIVNINYLQRPLIGQIKRSLKPAAYLMFETYLIDQRAIGHPKNPEYLLAHNELLDHFRGLRVLLYREGKFVDALEPSYRAGIFAQKIR
jgi:2-polyprenyl-3-methyl-5-hydroxy-6-metoxy-1,4-benzoquinol methylase